MTDQLEEINKKIDMLLQFQKDKGLKANQKYLTANDVSEITGLNNRTVLNRSNLEIDDPRYIPSLRMGSNRKYFERNVIERLFKLAKNSI